MMRRTYFFILLLLGLLLAGCGKKEAAPDEKPLEDGAVRTERHAFLLEDERVLIADVPETWRYVFDPQRDYYYFEDYFAKKRYLEQNPSAEAVEKGYSKQPYLTFMGMGEVERGDNFFPIQVRDGVWEEDRIQVWDRRSQRMEDVQLELQDFVSDTGVVGTWGMCVLEQDSPDKPAEYAGYIWDAQKTYSILLRMQKQEYDAKEQTIREFVKSVSFRTSDLGAERTKKVTERDVLTLHLRDEFMSLSLQLPEGLTFEKMDDGGQESRGMYGKHSYRIYLEEENFIELSTDLGGKMRYQTEEYRYDLNVKDFEEAVYEIPSAGYYFPNHFLMIWVNVDENEEELGECVKKIVQSVRFE